MNELNKAMIAARSAMEEALKLQRENLADLDMKANRVRENFAIQQKALLLAGAAFNKQHIKVREMQNNYRDLWCT